MVVAFLKYKVIYVREEKANEFVARQSLGIFEDYALTWGGS